VEIPLFKINWHKDDIEAIEQVIRSGKYWCIGPQIEQFEEKIAEYLGTKYCKVFNSGGSALHALMAAYSFGKGDEVILPSFTFIATAYAPMYVGAKPVFADVESSTYGLDPEDVKKRITSKTKAIMPIHYGGMSCQIDELKEIAQDAGVILIEDAAEAFGAKYRGKMAGTFGNSAMISFCQNKIFTTSEGGCVVTDDSEFLHKLDLLRSYGRELTGDYFAYVTSLDYVSVGYNHRMSSLLAALGISQISRVNDIIDLRRSHGDYLNRNLSKISDIVVPEPPSDDYYAVYQMYTIRVKDGMEKRDGLIEHLKLKGVSSKIYFDPVHRYSIFKDLGYKQDELPTTDLLATQVLTLPLYTDMTQKELDYIIDSVQSFF